VLFLPRRRVSAPGSRTGHRPGLIIVFEAKNEPRQAERYLPRPESSLAAWRPVPASEPPPPRRLVRRRPAVGCRGVQLERHRDARFGRLRGRPGARRAPEWATTIGRESNCREAERSPRHERTARRALEAFPVPAARARPRAACRVCPPRWSAPRLRLRPLAASLTRETRKSVVTLTSWESMHSAVARRARGPGGVATWLWLHPCPTQTSCG